MAKEFIEFEEIDIPTSIRDAYLFTAEKHAGQKRKFSNKPYIKHPEQVTCILSRYVCDKNMLTAALLHDTVEDTNATIEEIEEAFGKTVANIVNELTINKKEKKFLGKKKYMSNVFNNMSNEAFTIKLVDRIHNVMGLTNGFPTKDFIKWYWTETSYILEHLDREDIDEIQDELIKILEFLIGYIELTIL
jgi:(p)ppGpp synthase/HD superfamily hydrolase